MNKTSLTRGICSENNIQVLIWKYLSIFFYRIHRSAVCHYIMKKISFEQISQNYIYLCNISMNYLSEAPFAQFIRMYTYPSSVLRLNASYYILLCGRHVLWILHFPSVFWLDHPTVVGLFVPHSLISWRKYAITFVVKQEDVRKHCTWSYQKQHGFPDIAKVYLENRPSS